MKSEEVNVTREQTLESALRGLYEEVSDYIRINHLGPIYRNKVMQVARDALTSQFAVRSYVAPVQWEFEDQLPAYISTSDFDAMFEMSQVDGVRLYPFIEWNGQRIYLGTYEK